MSPSSLTQRLHSCSFLWFLFRILLGTPKKELLWSLGSGLLCHNVAHNILPILEAPIFEFRVESLGFLRV